MSLRRKSLIVCMVAKPNEKRGRNMIEKLRLFLFSLLTLLIDCSGADVTAMQAMNTDTDADLDYNIPGYPVVATYL